MYFNSMEFLLFFPIVVLVYYAIPQKIKWIWLLITSFFFYMCWSVKYSFLLMFTIVTTWVTALLIGKANKYTGKKKVYLRSIGLASCIVINLGILFVFKYGNFVIDNLSYLGIQNVSKFNIILPVGISFYTFQAIGYIADVYKGELEAEKNLGKYALFVSFFPQLIAGPIERAPHLMKQIHEIHKFEYGNAKNGLILMTWGLFQKVVLADRAGIVVNTVFNSYENYPGIWRLFAAILFSVQIYCDFGGYSNIAIGAAKVMGFELMDNFDTPYFAQSIKEFWRRWHISLSQWLRDYIYIPMGGGHCSKKRKYFNIMVTFAISGLWHGAGWNYIVWGLLHGTYQVVGEFSKPARDNLKEILHIRETELLGCFRCLITFSMVTLAWIFFRMSSLTNALCFINGMFTDFQLYRIMDAAQWNSLGITAIELWFLSVFIVCLFAVSLIHRRQPVLKLLANQNIMERWIVYFILIFTIILFGAYGMEEAQTQFIYFQF